MVNHERPVRVVQFRLAKSFVEFGFLFGEIKFAGDVELYALGQAVGLQPGVDIGDGVDGVEQSFVAVAEAEVQHAIRSCLAKRLGAGLLRRLQHGVVVGAGVGRAVRHGDDVARRELGGVLVIIISQHNAQRGAAEQPPRHPALPWTRPGLEPTADAGRLVMKNGPPEKRAAEHHHDPVAVNGVAQAGRGDTVEIIHAVSQPQPNGLEAVAENEE